MYFVNHGFLTTDPHSPDNRTVRPKQALLFFGMTGLCFVCTGIRRTSTSFPTSGTIIEKGSQPVQGCRQNQNRGEMELCLQQSDMCVLPHCRRHWNSTGNAAARSWAEAAGCVWAGKRIGTLIDLSGLGLDQIEEQDGWVRIGAMVSRVSWRPVPLLKERFGSLFADMTGHIVGVQFRECATFGGSVWGRFGFSDILTGLLALDCEVELAEAGRIPLRDFAARKGRPGYSGGSLGTAGRTEGSVPYCAQCRYRLPGAGLCCFPRGRETALR